MSWWEYDLGIIGIHSGVKQPCNRPHFWHRWSWTRWHLKRRSRENSRSAASGNGLNQLVDLARFKHAALAAKGASFLQGSTVFHAQVDAGVVWKRLGMAGRFSLPSAGSKRQIRLSRKQPPARLRRAKADQQRLTRTSRWRRCHDIPRSFIWSASSLGKLSIWHAALSSCCPTGDLKTKKSEVFSPP